MLRRRGLRAAALTCFRDRLASPPLRTATPVCYYTAVYPSTARRIALSITVSSVIPLMRTWVRRYYVIT
jgi:hypothetical protein